MGVSAPVAAKANGLSTVLNVITSPAEAFATLRISPMWGWAFAIALVLAVAGQYLATPATIHAVQASWPAQIASNPRMAAMSAEQQQHMLDTVVSFSRFGWVFAPVTLLLVALLQAVVMLVFRAIGKGEGSFKHLWCASMNASVIGVGFYYLVSGLIATVRGPAAYLSVTDALRAMPSLAWLAPSAPVKAIAFLSAFNVISIWGAAVLAIAMIQVARVSKFNAAACSAVVTMLAGLYVTLSVH